MFSSNYPCIRQLGGIGNRLTRRQIRDKTSPGILRHNVFVRGHAMSSQQFEALLTFVAGL